MEPKPGLVKLTKEAPKVSLDKHGVTAGLIKVQLNWTSPRTAAAERARQAQGMWQKLRASVQAGSAQDADLDLGCMMSYDDGSTFVVQALGKSFGALDRYPYVRLDGDDRTGARAAGENLAINLDHQERFTKLLLYVYIYEGSGDFRNLDAVVTLSSDQGDRFEVRLDECPPGAQGCAIALLTRQGGGLEVGREVRWFRPKSGKSTQEQISRAYDFAIGWKAGRK